MPASHRPVEPLDLNAREWLLTGSLPVSALLIIAALRSRALHGMGDAAAHELARLIVMPTVLFLLLTGLRRQRHAIRQSLAIRWLTPGRLLLCCIIGVALRALYLAATVLRGSVNGTATADLSLPAIACPERLALALVATALIVPLVEEIVHRGIVLAGLLRFGTAAAVVGSAILFMLLHRYTNWGWSLVGGMLFAVLYLQSGSLWAPLIVHSLYNALFVIESLCLPLSNAIPGAGNTVPLAASVCAVSLTLIALCLWRLGPGPPDEPGPNGR